MKNRRSTILVAVMVALVGTPKVWQEVGNLLAGLQHKTQSRLLSMVLSSQVQDDRGEMLAANMPVNYGSACPASKPGQVAGESKPADFSSSVKPRVRVRASAAVNSEEHFALAERIVNETRGEASLPGLEHSLARRAENNLTMHGINNAPRELVMNESNIAEVTALRQFNVVAPTVWIEKEADLQKLKKALEEGKAVRQKVRYIVGKSTVVVPAT